MLKISKLTSKAISELKNSVTPVSQSSEKPRNLTVLGQLPHAILVEGLLGYTAITVSEAVIAYVRAINTPVQLIHNDLLVDVPVDVADYEVSESIISFIDAEHGAWLASEAGQNYIKKQESDRAAAQAQLDKAVDSLKTVLNNKADNYQVELAKWAINYCENAQFSDVTTHHEAIATLLKQSFSNLIPKVELDNMMNDLNNKPSTLWEEYHPDMIFIILVSSFCYQLESKFHVPHPLFIHLFQKLTEQLTTTTP